MQKNFKSLNGFIEENTELFSQPIIKSFFEQNPTNLILLEASVIYKIEEATQQLDKLFVEHFFLYKLMKYISTLSYNFSIDFDRRRKKHKTRFPLLVDHSYKNEDGESSNLSSEFIIDKQCDFNTHFENMSERSLLELIESEVIYKAFINLTAKEKRVLELMIMNQMKQNEIAQIFDESPQNIAKTKKRALKKLRRDLVEFNY